MNREEFENTVSYYLKPNSLKVDVKKIKSSSTQTQVGGTLKGKNQLYAYSKRRIFNNPLPEEGRPTEEEIDWIFMYALEDKHYFFRTERMSGSYALKDGWTISFKGQGGEDATGRFVERMYNFGNGWGVYPNDSIVYFLSHLPTPFNFINWSDENPLEVKQ